MEVAAEHTSGHAMNGWQDAPPRPSLDERACQPLPQARVWRSVAFGVIFNIGLGCWFRSGYR